MTNKIIRAKHYRERAEELRTIAQDWIGREPRVSLLTIAIDYERMAESLERLAAEESRP